LDFGFQWHDSLIPIAQNYTAIQRAVVECAYAGCETIWITVGDGQEPLIRDILGDYVEDPVWYYRKHARFPSEHRKQIPIFYVPVHPKDIGRRDCMAWGILNSAASAYYTSKKISGWLTPTRYYVAFPYGLYDPALLRTHRAAISSRSEHFYLSYNDKTIADGELLGFTFGSRGFVRIRRQFRELEKSLRCEGNRNPGKNLPLADVFNVIDPDFVESPSKIEVPSYNNISDWAGYTTYMRQQNLVERPKIKILKNGKKSFALPPII
jgi:hypothetical protein